MNLFFKTMSVILLLCLPLGMSPAKTIVLEVDSDCDVDSSAPLASFPSGTELETWCQETGATDRLVYSCLHFTAPPDWNPQTCTDFTLQLQLADTQEKKVVYGFIVREDHDVDSVDDLTWDTAPGRPLVASINNTTNVNTSQCTFLTNILSVEGVAGDVVVGNPLIMASHTLPAISSDTDGRFTLFYHIQSATAAPFSFASKEHATYAGPRLSLTYEPAKVAVDQGTDYVTVMEGNGADSYSVYLTSAPTSDVTVTLDYDADQLVVSPTVLTFTPANYATPQIISVDAVDDPYAERDVRQTITHAASSADASFDGVYISTVHVNVVDNDAKTASVMAIKDSTVMRSTPATSYPTGDLQLRKFAGTPSNPKDITVSFVQFQLPADHKYSVEAALSFVQTSAPNPANASKLYLFGIYEDLPQANADAFTWLNAPGLDTRMAFADGMIDYDTEEVVYLGDLDVAVEGAAGQELATLGSESAAIANWLSTDIDGLVTLMIVREQEDEFTDTLASVEGGSGVAPRLDIFYGTDPYCGRPGQVYDLADVTGDCIVNLLDLSQMAADWME